MYTITKQDINILWNRLAQAISQRKDVIIGYIEDELDKEWETKFITTLEELMKCVSNDAIIMTSGTGVSYPASSYFKPNNTVLGSLIDAGRLVLGNDVSSKTDNCLAKPNVEFETSKTGKVLTSTDWNTYLEVISKYFKLNWSLSPVNIHDVLLTSLNGIWVKEEASEEFRRFSTNGSLPFEFSYVMGYKSELISKKTGALQQDMENFKFVTYLLSGKGGNS